MASEAGTGDYGRNSHSRYQCTKLQLWDQGSTSQGKVLRSGEELGFGHLATAEQRELGHFYQLQEHLQRKFSRHAADLLRK